jgi:hypothetical protein
MCDEYGTVEDSAVARENVAATVNAGAAPKSLPSEADVANEKRSAEEIVSVALKGC